MVSPIAQMISAMKVLVSIVIQSLRSRTSTYFYKGDENYMVLTTEYNMMLHCNYKLESYPFDTQKCSMEVSDF